MINDEEIISNMSYTNNDFRSIFPQLLDTAKTLTNKWDPSLSNESDPGNILLKEAAIVGDKNNYHIDKNVLECFPLSATQQASARQLYDIAGYRMHWYNSAKTTISFSLLKTLSQIQSAELSELSDYTLQNITIPAMTQVSDSSGSYVYTTLQKAILNNSDSLANVNAIQGIINKYEINGDSTITIDKLDENLRIYLPYSTVAENGIYVCKNDTNVKEVGLINSLSDSNTLDMGDFWELVDNVNLYKVGSKIFSFGVDLTSDNCYIQFPEDISDLIDEGLNIYYTTTQGESGSIKAKTLEMFVSDVTNTAEDTTFPINDYILIKNNKASTLGENQESLSDAYKNYKKTIGTYNTLVTRRDYENAIYNLKNGQSDDNLISNGVVTDRTTDPNYSQTIVAKNSAGNYLKVAVAKHSGEPYLNSYDVVLYLQKAVKNVSTTNDYNDTFEPETDEEDILRGINQQLDEYKAIQHNLNYVSTIPDSMSANVLYSEIRNYFAINGTLNTYHKISKKEASEIQSNVISALIQTYNSRELDFGNQITHDELISTIQNADDRIKSVSLNIPMYEPRMVYMNGVETPLYDNDYTATNNKTVAKMILSGNVQLFEFKNDFQLDFGQAKANYFSNISSAIVTNPILISNNAQTPQTLAKNDIIQLLKPNYNVIATYDASVYYKANFNCDANTTHVLTGDEKINFIYYENGVWKNHLYSSGTIINPKNITIQDKGTPSDTAEYTGYAYLTAGQSVDIIEPATFDLSVKTRYYIICQTTNGDEYELVLNSTNNYNHILGTDEYFLYLDDNSNIGILGVGTKISSSSTDVILKSPIVSLEDIVNEEVDIASSTWNTLESSLTLTENEIVTLIEGDSIYIDGPTTYVCNSKSQWGSVDTSLERVFMYKFKETSEFTAFNTPTMTDIYIRGTVQLNVNNQSPQTLVNNQGITFVAGAHTALIWANGVSIDGALPSISGVNTFLSNYPLTLVGGENIDLQTLDELTGQYTTDLCIYYYEPTDMIDDISSRTNNILTVTKTDAASHNLNYTFNQFGANVYYLLPISYKIKSNTSTAGTITLGLSDSNDKIDTAIKILKGDTTDSSYEINGIGEQTATGNLTLAILVSSLSSGSTLSITFDANCDSSDFVAFDYFKLTSGVNTEEINSENVANGKYYKYEINLSDVITQLNLLPGANDFDWSYQVPDSDKVLAPVSGDAYFNKNHVYNQITLPKIDFNNSSIIVGSSNIQ